ncbi:MAG: flavodoxin domain-containing protein [Bacteroidota bacterium]
MKGAIVYRGKYGATKQYAEWLGAELNLPVIPAGEINGPALKEYDYLLLGTSVYIGKLQVKKWLKKNGSFLRGKKVFLFQVAGTPPEEKGKRLAYNNAAVLNEIAGNWEYFFLRGRMIMNKLSWKDRFMLKMGAMLTKDPKEKKTMLTDYDDVKKEELINILTDVKNYIQPAPATACEIMPAAGHRT